MPYVSKTDKIEHPQSHYATPDELIDDGNLSLWEKIDALSTWEQDARQMLTASGEGMEGSEEGEDPNDQTLLGQVERAKDRLQAHKPDGAALSRRRQTGSRSVGRYRDC